MPPPAPSAAPPALAPSGGLRRRLALRLLALTVLYLVWEVTARVMNNPTFIPSPGAVWDQLITTSTTHDGVRGYSGHLLVEHLGVSLRRIVIGSVIGVVGGLAIGVLLGTVSWLRVVAAPFASTAHYSLLAALDSAGVKESELTIVDLEPQDILAAWTRGDIDAAYSWLPSLDELRKTGKVLVTSRELAAAGKPTLDLGVVSTAFATAHPDAVDAWRKAQAQALTIIADDPDAAAKSVGAELNLSADEAKAQLAQGVFLKPADLASPEWLGTEGAPGKLADNLVSAAEFLKSQQKIDAVPSLADVQKALYVKGLPGVLG